MLKVSLVNKRPIISIGYVTRVPSTLKVRNGNCEVHFFSSGDAIPTNPSTHQGSGDLLGYHCANKPEGSECTPIHFHALFSDFISFSLYLHVNICNLGCSVIKHFPALRSIKFPYLSVFIWSCVQQFSFTSKHSYVV